MRQVRKSFSDLGNTLNNLADNLVHAARASFAETPDWDADEKTADDSGDAAAAADFVRSVLVAATECDWGEPAAETMAEASGDGGASSAPARKPLAAWMQKKGTKFPHPWQVACRRTPSLRIDHPPPTPPPRVASLRHLPNLDHHLPNQDRFIEFNEASARLKYSSKEGKEGATWLSLKGDVLVLAGARLSPVPPASRRSPLPPFPPFPPFSPSVAACRLPSRHLLPAPKVSPPTVRHLHSATTLHLHSASILRLCPRSSIWRAQAASLHRSRAGSRRRARW